MAIDPSARYSGQIDTGDPTGYPFGKAQNETALGARNGTPLEKDLVNDLFGFQQAILNAAGLTPSGTPDKVGASQYLTALGSLRQFSDTLAITRNWGVPVTVAASSALITSLAFDATLGMFAACWDVSGVPAVKTSVGGQHWITQTLSLVSDFASPLLARKPGGNFLIAGTRAGTTTAKYMTSPDGVTWTTRNSFSSPPFAATSLAYDAARGIFVSTLATNVVETSTDGVTWSPHSCPISSIGKGGIASNSSIIVVCGDSNGTDIVYMTSPDGAVWTARTFATGIFNTMQGICFSAVRGKFFLVHAGFATPNVFVASSPDGITWTDTATNPFPTGCQISIGSCVAEVNGFVVVGYRIGGVAYVVASPDGGVTWIPVFSFPEGTFGPGIFSNGTRFVARTQHDTIALSASV